MLGLAGPEDWAGEPGLELASLLGELVDDPTARQALRALIEPQLRSGPL